MNEESETVAFGAALDALKEGEFVKRQHWYGEFLFAVGPTDVAKKEITDDRLKFVMGIMGQDVLADTGNIRLMRQSSGEVINGWVPSQEDMLSSDWKKVRQEDLIDYLAISKLSDLIIDEEGNPIPGFDPEADGGVIDTIAEVFDACGVEYGRAEDEQAVLVMRGPFDGLFVVNGGPDDQDEAEDENAKKHALYRVLSPSTKESEGQFILDGGGHIMSELVTLNAHRDQQDPGLVGGEK